MLSLELFFLFVSIAGQQFMQNPAMAAQRGALGLYGQGLPNQGGSDGQQQASSGNAPSSNLAGFGSDGQQQPQGEGASDSNFQGMSQQGASV